MGGRNARSHSSCGRSDGRTTLGGPGRGPCGRVSTLLMTSNGSGDGDGADAFSNTTIGPDRSVAVATATAGAAGAPAAMIGAAGAGGTGPTTHGGSAGGTDDAAPGAGGAVPTPGPSIPMGSPSDAVRGRTILAGVPGRTGGGDDSLRIFSAVSRASRA